MTGILSFIALLRFSCLHHSAWPPTFKISFPCLCFVENVTIEYVFVFTVVLSLKKYNLVSLIFVQLFIIYISAIFQKMIFYYTISYKFIQLCENNVPIRIFQTNAFCVRLFKNLLLISATKMNTL